MLGSGRTRSLLAAVTVGGALLVAACGGTEAAEHCNSACIKTWEKWIAGGAVGSVPVGATGYCLEHPEVSYC